MLALQIAVLVFACLVGNVVLIKEHVFGDPKKEDSCLVGAFIYFFAFHPLANDNFPVG